MTANPKHIFNDLASSKLELLLSSSGGTMTLVTGGVLAFLGGWVSGSEMYLTLMDSVGNTEVVKVTAISGDVLTVSRGQDGTIAREWPAGTTVVQRLVAANLTAFLQKGVFRSIQYNPNGILAAAYWGEKVYQSGPSASQHRWWKHTEDLKWRLIAGLLYGSESQDDDGYVSTPASTLYANADVAAAGWSAAGGPASLYGCLNDGSDATYIHHDQPSVCELAFQDPGIGVGWELALTIQAASWNAPLGKLGISFYTGSTLIGDQYIIGTDEVWKNVGAPPDPGFFTYEISWIGVTLTQAEADDLRIRLELMNAGIKIGVSYLKVEYL